MIQSALGKEWGAYSLGNCFGGGGQYHLSSGTGAEKSEERFGLLVFGDRGKGFLML